MKDRRSITSRKNLGQHIPEALSARGTAIVTVRLPIETVERIDKARGDMTRSEYLRSVLDTTRV